MTLSHKLNITIHRCIFIFGKNTFSTSATVWLVIFEVCVTTIRRYVFFMRSFGCAFFILYAVLGCRQTNRKTVVSILSAHGSFSFLNCPFLIVPTLFYKQPFVHESLFSSYPTLLAGWLFLHENISVYSLSYIH